MYALRYPPSSLVIPKKNKYSIVPYDLKYNVKCVCVYVFVVIPFILDVRLVDVPAMVTQEKGHTGLLHLPSARCVPSFFSLEGFSRSFPSSTVKSNFVY